MQTGMLCVEISKLVMNLFIITSSQECTGQNGRIVYSSAYAYMKVEVGRTIAMKDRVLAGKDEGICRD